jgi:hypothetical protein
MKKIISNYLKTRNIALILFIVLVTAVIFSTEANGQSRHGHGGGGRFGRGIFRNSVHFTPRIGARIRVLPLGYMSFWFGGFPYYYYDGIYYQYYPQDETYVVVKKPAGADNVPNLKFDQVRMYDGSTLEGVFENATDSTITLRIGDKDHSINIGNIISITFAPSQKDTTQHK